MHMEPPIYRMNYSPQERIVIIEDLSLFCNTKDAVF